MHKRILFSVMVLAMLFVCVGTVQASPFGFGPRYMDDQKDLLENVAVLLRETGSNATIATFNGLDLPAHAGISVAFLGLSKYANNHAPLKLMEKETYGDTYIYAHGSSSTSINFPVNVESDVFNYEDLLLRDSHRNDYDLAQMGTYIQVTGGDISYQPADSSEIFTIESGSYIFGFTYAHSDNLLDAFMVLNIHHTPIPGAALLLGSGIVGIVALRRKI